MTGNSILVDVKGTISETQMVTAHVAVKEVTSVAVEKVLKMEQPFCYTDRGEVPVPGDTVEVQIDAQHTGLFHIEWPELRADDFMEAGVYEISGKVSGVKDQTVTAIVIVDYNAALADAEAVKKLGAYNMQENFAYVSTPDDKVRLNDIKGITNKSLILYQWTDHMLIENCTTHEYGFDYGVYPSSNSANPEYVIMRAPDMNGFMVRGTSQKHADENFRFYTSADGTTWTEVTNYDKTEDTSREGWPSRIYLSEELPENSNYLKIAFPGSYTWEYNLNSVQIYRGAKKVKLGTDGSGDAYTTIRHFNAGYNQQTMTYKFAVAEGYYDIVTGFYDPWSQYANDDRHAKITVTDADSNVLASKADYKISGNKDTVTLSEVRVGSAGNISVNLSPVKNVPSNLDSCDVLVSFIVIIKKADQERNYTVNLTVTEPVHVAYYGTAVTTPDIAEGKGTVQVAAEIKNDGNGAASVSVKQTVYELDGTEPVAEGEKTQAQSVAAGETAKITDTVTVAEPKLWDTENPNMYTVRTEVYVNDTLTDTYDSDFGFRWVEFTTENGFFLNGENRKLRGVCMHHDQGALGAEAWRRAVERQVEMMQEMGVNAIRVTHNPASQALIDICNRKGMMLVEESFDCWLSGKDENTEDYGKWFDTEIEEGNQITGAVQDEKWCEFDVKAMVRRGRNAPAIIMWSLGNELFQSTISGSRHGEYPDVAKNLFGWVNQEDATRYVTFGDNQFKGQETNGSSNATKTAWVFTDADQYGFPGGLPGYNYGWDGQIQNGHNQGWLVYGSETASSVNSRGVYDRKNNCSDDGSGDRRLTSYDKSKVSWGHLAAEGLWITMRQAFNAGEFVWTGFDYIGEPTPYNWTGTGSNGTWPNVSKSSYFGIVDTAGFEKDSFYLYQSQWNDKVNTLHILPVWNEDEIMIDSNGKVEVVMQKYL